VVEIRKPNSNPIEIETLLKSYGAGKPCYAISWIEGINGKKVSLHTVLEHAVGLGLPSFISCISGKVVYFEAEQMLGAPPGFILKREI
jgi:hypothetical protein